MIRTTQGTHSGEQVWNACSKANDGQQPRAKGAARLLGRLVVVAGSGKTWKAKTQWVVRRKK